MPTTETLVAAIAQPAPGQLVLSGSWTARAIGDIDPHLAALLLSDAVLDQSSGKPAAQPTIQIDGSQLISIDSIGIWVLQRRLQSFRDQGASSSYQDGRRNIKKCGTSSASKNMLRYQSR